MVQSSIKKSRKEFTDYELKYIAQHHDTQTFAEMAFILDRSTASIKSKWERLQREPHLVDYLKRDPVERIIAFDYYKTPDRFKKHFTRDERAIVIQNYSYQTGHLLARKLGRSEGSVRMNYYNWRRKNPEGFHELLFVDVEELAEFLGIEEDEE